MKQPEPNQYTSFSSKDTPDFGDATDQRAITATQTTKPPSRRFPRVGSFLGLLVIIIGIGYWFGSKTKDAKPVSDDTTVSVKVATVAKTAVPIQIRAIGNVEATSIVSVKAMISGELTKIHFKQGQDVKQGDLLFSIDARPYEAALNQAKATLARDEALVKQYQSQVEKDRAQQRNAQLEAERYVTLHKEGIVSSELVDKYQADAASSSAIVQADLAAVKNAEAALEADKAAIANAQIQLSYTTIRSPLTGRTGNLAVYEGNLIRANDTTALVTIAQVSPVFVTFAVPEKDLVRINAFRKAGIHVDVSFPQDEQHPISGKLIFVDNTVDNTTGTIKLKASFDNSEGRLWPGQFVNVILTLTIQPDAIVVPTEAVQTGQDGSFVYAVAGGKADIRRITTGATMNGLTVVEKGLEPKEMVVTDGQLRLFPGAKVVVNTGK